MKSKSINLTLKSAVAIALLSTVGCGPSAESENTDNQEPVVEETTEVEVVEEEPAVYWVVTETMINEIPVVTEPTLEVKSAEKSAAKPADKPAEKPAMKPAAKPVTHEALKTSFVNSGYEPQPVEITEAIVPLDETQTLVSYNNKGKYQDAVQVVSDGDGNVNQIVFAHKKHKDVYNVENGMTAKQVKELRKDMKHMVKHGKAFLYNDSSNVMYMLDIQDAEGNELTDVQVENSSVSAIIWKDKKHHKKEEK